MESLCPGLQGSAQAGSPELQEHTGSAVLPLADGEAGPVVEAMCSALSGQELLCCPYGVLT